MQTYYNTTQSQVAPFVAARILAQLEAGKRVLWLLSGGSGGAVCVQVSKHLQGHDLSNLFVTMSDERYGVVGHADENIQQLLDNGLALQGATLYRPLTGDSLEQTTKDFASWLQTTSRSVDYRIAVMGVGKDAHTSGVKPHSLAVTSPEPAVSFVGEDFTRITTTLTFIKTLDEAIVQLYGTDKHSLVPLLEAGEGTEADMPMLATRAIARVTIFSDYQKERT